MKNPYEKNAEIASWSAVFRIYILLAQGGDIEAREKLMRFRNKLNGKGEKLREQWKEIFAEVETCIEETAQLFN